MTIRENVLKFLRWSEKWTKTDMVYLAKGGFWLSFTSFFVFLISFSKMIVFGRFLPKETFGTYSYIIAMLGILGLFSLPGINTSIVKSIAQKKDGTFLLAIKTRIKWSLIGSFFSLIISTWYFINGNNLLGILFLITALFLPFLNSFTIFPYFLKGKKRFGAFAKYEIITSFLIALFLIPTIILTNNIIIIIIVFFLSQSLLYGRITQKTLKDMENKEEDKEAIYFGKNLTVMSVISSIAGHIDKIIIWKFLGPAQVAIYSFAQTPISRIVGLNPISSLALPKLGERNIKDIKKEILKKFGKLFLVSIPFAVIISIIAPLFYKIALPQYIDSVPYFRAFIIVIALLPFELINSALISTVKTKELYILNIVSPFLNIVLFLVLTPFFGIWGIISAILISHTIGSLLSLYFFMKI